MLQALVARDLWKTASGTRAKRALYIRPKAPQVQWARKRSEHYMVDRERCRLGKVCEEGCHHAVKVLLCGNTRYLSVTVGHVGVVDVAVCCPV